MKGNIRKTQYGFTLAAGLYIQKNAEGKLPAIAVSGPFRSRPRSKVLVSMHRPWQSVDLSPSLSTRRLQTNLPGEPRRTASPEINTEDFLAAVDYSVAR